MDSEKKWIPKLAVEHSGGKLQSKELGKTITAGYCDKEPGKRRPRARQWKEVFIMRNVFNWLIVQFFGVEGECAFLWKTLNVNWYSCNITTYMEMWHLLQKPAPDWGQSIIYSAVFNFAEPAVLKLAMGYPCLSLRLYLYAAKFVGFLSWFDAQNSLQEYYLASCFTWILTVINWVTCYLIFLIASSWS